MKAPSLLGNPMVFFADFILASVLFMLWVILLRAVLTLRAGRAKVQTTGAKPTRPEPVR